MKLETSRFNVKLSRIGLWIVLRLPERESLKLASRGIVMIKGKLNGIDFKTVLEPDGKGSHWFKIDDQLCGAAGVKAGDTVKLSIQPTKEWLEPDISHNLNEALMAEGVYDIWKDLTPLAHWDWIRWINATRVPETRKRRIEKACSMLKSGKRRPCCFNRNLCCEPAVSKNGVLLESGN